MTEISPLEFSLLKKFLFEISGIEVPDNKRYLFTTRLGEFLRQKGYVSFSELYTRLATGKDAQLQREFVQSMTTHESSFFRDTRPFNLLLYHLLPEIARRNQAGAVYLPPRIRILSAGCSLGQETYSIAMCVKSWLETQKQYCENDVTILGIDISQRVLERAKQGVYSEMEVGSTIPARLRQSYMGTRPDGRIEVNAQLKGMVRFIEHNLMESISALGKFDIIFCRNVIIYFPPELKRKILKHFARQLNRDGVLIMGASETTYNLCEEFTAVQREDYAYFTPQG